MIKDEPPSASGIGSDTNAGTGSVSAMSTPKSDSNSGAIDTSEPNEEAKASPMDASSTPPAVPQKPKQKKGRNH